MFCYVVVCYLIHCTEWWKCCLVANRVSAAAGGARLFMLQDLDGAYEGPCYHAQRVRPHVLLALVQREYLWFALVVLSSTV